ncbi:hypothetical protein EV130_104110 [Rhizobium azibense]|uniref:Uncharacterized protein n=1 Tax=Rhizobium azibense TaxID=1136135 RepID=A0A4R3QYM6_9HYPH|nr:hypothetical protein EV130_104110 [Rhizobium azibense]
MLAGKLQQPVSVRLELLRQPNDAFSIGDHAFEQMAARRKIQLPQIMPVEIEQVERHQERFAGDLLAAPAAERLLQQPEVGSATIIDHDCLAVGDRRRRGELILTIP